MEAADQAPVIFARELEGLLAIAAQNVRTTFTFRLLDKRTATRMSARSANHAGGPDGGDGLRLHPLDRLIAQKWSRPSGKSTD